MQQIYKLLLPATALLTLVACSNDTDTEQASATTNPTVQEATPAPLSPATNTTGRWYTAQQVAQGEKLYQLHCASCHGSRAQATADWKKTGSNGMYPPPPLNGTAHAWHHSLNLLRKTIREGGVRLGGQMPGFADKLTAQDIDAILAWVQTHWPEQIYQAWLTRSGLTKR